MNFKSILIILICIFLFYIINLAINKKESFTSFSPDKILENCKDNFGKDYKKLALDCNKSAFVSEPGYLCGICGDDSNYPVTMIKNSKDSDLNYYGCGTKIYNGLSWNFNKETITLNKLLAEKITCNNKNKESISNMYLYVCADDSCTKIIIDGNSKLVIPVNVGSWTKLNSYFIENIKYGTEIEITVENTGGPGGFCISYIWNKQLYILDNNGFQNTANIINYTCTGNKGWDSLWYNTNQITNLFPWMHNWIKIAYSSNDKSPTYGSIKFKIGDTQKNGFMTNDITVFLGIDDNGSVLLNGNPIYNKSKQEWNKSIFFNIPNVKDNAKLEFKCINTRGPGGIGVAYLRSGYLFTLPSSEAGFNSVANIMKYTTTNCDGLTYDPSSIKNNLSFLTSWENTSVVGDFSLTTNIGESNSDTWTYDKSKDWMIIEQNKNPIYKWKDLNINSNSNMSISFLLYISNTYNNWRNIFHISNNNNDCCIIGDRVPGLWIYPESTRLLLVNDIKKINNNKHVGANSDVSTNDGIRLNRDCFITMTWSNTTVSIYENGLLKASKDYKLPLIAAIPEASFYIGDPWYKANKGIKIKDFTIYNYVLSQRQIEYMYKKITIAGFGN
jgi:hypothetical protein